MRPERIGSQVMEISDPELRGRVVGNPTVSKRFLSTMIAEARGAPFSGSLVKAWLEHGT